MVKGFKSRNIDDIILRDGAKTFAEAMIIMLDGYKERAYFDPKTGKRSDEE